MATDEKIESPPAHGPRQGAAVSQGAPHPVGAVGKPGGERSSGVGDLPGNGHHLPAAGMGAERRQQVPVVQLDTPHPAEGVGEENQSPEGGRVGTGHGMAAPLFFSWSSRFRPAGPTVSRTTPSPSVNREESCPER